MVRIVLCDSCLQNISVFGFLRKKGINSQLPPQSHRLPWMDGIIVVIIFIDNHFNNIQVKQSVQVGHIASVASRRSVQQRYEQVHVRRTALTLSKIEAATASKFGASKYLCPPLQCVERPGKLVDRSLFQTFSSIPGSVSS